MAEKFEPANDATAESGRKTWQAPVVIVGELEEAEANPTVNSDGLIGS